MYNPHTPDVVSEYVLAPFVFDFVCISLLVCLLEVVKHLGHVRFIGANELSGWVHLKLPLRHVSRPRVRATLLDF